MNFTSVAKTEADSLSIIRQIPWPENVTELHTHLGGAVPLYRLWEIAIDRGIRGLGRGYNEFINNLKISDDRVHNLESYLEVYDRVELIQSGPQAIRESIIIAIHRAYRTGGNYQHGLGGEGLGKPLFNVGKLELRFNPLKRTGAVFLKGQHAGLYDVDRVIKAACDAAEEVEIGFNGSIRVGLIFCFGRDMTYEANKILAEKTSYWSQKYSNIIGVDLAGAESANPLSDTEELRKFSEIFNLLPSHLGRTLHVGETPYVDLSTFIKTIIALNPSRVAHPIVAFRNYLVNKDDRGLRLLKERGIVCEFCVKSNLLTKAVSDISEYKEIISLCDKWDIPYTFSTDAPSLQNNTLAEELIMLIHSRAASAEQILRALEFANQYSFIKN
jgi:adenosine deaminase